MHAGGVHIGVVIPAFDAAAWIGDAVASVLAQTHRDWSLVVVDDGSTDATADVVSGFADQRIRLIRQDNGGVSAARNRGFAAFCATPSRPPFPLREGVGGRGCAVLFLDADDWLAPDALAGLAGALGATPDAVAASGPCTFVGTGTTRIPPSGDILHRLLVRNLFANGGHLLIRSEAVGRAGGFLPDVAYGEDWEFWIRIALQGPFAEAESRAPVLFVRRHAGGAYRRLATDPGAFTPCMDAIFGNPALIARFGSTRLATIRRRTEAENCWIIGRELVRQDRRAEGRMWLRRSVWAHPTLKRAALLVAAGSLPMLPAAIRGPFRPYSLP